MPLSFAVAAILLSAAWCVVFAPFIQSYFELGIAAAGHFNGIAILILMAWFLADVVFDRKQLYHFFGFIDPPFRFWVGPLRSFLLIVLSVVSLIDLLQVKLFPINEGYEFFATFAVVASVFVAALGIVLSNFQMQVASRSDGTREAIKELLQDKSNIEIKKSSRLITQYLTGDPNHKGSIPLISSDHEFIDCLEHFSDKYIYPDNLIRHSLYEKSKTNSYIYSYLNSLERIAASVRCGVYDFSQINDSLWEIILSNYIRFYKYIESECEDLIVIDQFNSQGVLIKNHISKFALDNLCWLAFYCHRKSSDTIKERFKIGVAHISI